ncbi:MAG: hypothetical protein HQM13_03970 [SAR324 cluster bacterium]|nr:hypothetical protein [SAR324 cluster bacterium]
MRIQPKILFTLFVLLSFFGGSLSGQETAVVSGRVIPPGTASLPETAMTVVLLKFEINSEGKLETKGPVAQVQTQDSGNYKFDPIPLETKVAYQLGSSFEGKIVQSNFFFLKPGQSSINVDLLIPSITDNVEAIQVISATMFIESDIGRLQITEVLRLHNPTNEFIETRKSPLVFNLPESFTNFEALQQNPNAPKNYELLGTRLQYFRQFPPGESTIIFRYGVPAYFGNYTLHRKYLHEFKEGKVMTPVNQLTIKSSQLNPAKSEKLGETALDAWEMASVQQPELEIEVGAIPVQQVLYAYLGIAVFLVLMLLAIFFVRIRLK